MGKKKGKRAAPPLHGTPCPALKFLEEYSTITEPLKNGHVMFAYLKNGRCAKTAAEVLGGEVTYFRVRAVVKAGEKSRRYDRPADVQRLLDFAAIEFRPEKKQEKPSVETHENDEMEVEPVQLPEAMETPEASKENTPSLRSTSTWTPRKLAMKSRIHDMALKSSAKSKKQREDMRNLRPKLKCKRPPKAETQARKRLLATVARLKKRITAYETGDVLHTVRMENAKLKASLRYYKKKCGASEETVEDRKDEEIARLNDKCMAKDDRLCFMEQKLVELEERQEDADWEDEPTKGKRAYCSDMRMVVYQAVMNQVPTANIQPFLKAICNRYKLPVDDVPSRSSVERMTRELGCISEMQAAEFILAHEDLTIGFDATTQEGRHFNSIHVTSQSCRLVLAIDELAGGTAVDYAQHIETTFRRLAETYSHFSGADTEAIHNTLVAHIANTFSDRCAANHAAIKLVAESWQKGLNELYCHVHPLDSFASRVRSCLKRSEAEVGPVPHGVFGNDCAAGNIVWAMNKMRSVCYIYVIVILILIFYPQI